MNDMINNCNSLKMFVGRITLLLQRVCLIIIAILLFSSCHDDYDDEQATIDRHTAEMKEKILGCWTFDADGISDHDIMSMEMNFKDNDSLLITYYFYDYLENDYLAFTIKCEYNLNGTGNFHGHPMEKLYLKPDAESANQFMETWNEYARQMDIEDASFEFEDSEMYIGLKNDSLAIPVIIEEDTLTTYTQEELEEITAYAKKGAFEPSYEKIAQLRAALDAAIDVCQDYYEGDEPDTYLAPRQASPKKVTGIDGRDLTNWMSQIKDNPMICKMMIPGTHDTGTYHMELDHMWTIGQTQELDIKEQWEHGIRCFDLRVRNKGGRNYIFHDFLDCRLEMEDIFKQLQKLLLKHPQDGAIVYVKAEGNVMADQTAIKYLASTCPIYIDDTPVDKRAVMQNTTDLVKKYFYDKWVDNHRLLAQFDPTMRLDDLRGRVLVILQEAPTNGEVYYGELDDYLANATDKQYSSLSGDVNKTARVEEQNLWEQGKDGESEDGYVYRKAAAFKDNLEFTRTHPNDTTWAFNAANGYFWDPITNAVIKDLKIIPDYASFAQKAYPVFTNDIARLGDVSGIVLIDYVGKKPFKRVTAGRMVNGTAYGLTITTLGLIGISVATPFLVFSFPASVAGVFMGTGAVLGSLITAGIVDWMLGPLLVFYCNWAISKMSADTKDPKAQDLVNTIIEVNFPKTIDTGFDEDPIDVARIKKHI